MSDLIETDPVKIAKKERKESITRIVSVLGFAAGLIGIIYAVRPDYYQQELKNNYYFCSDLLEKTSDNAANINFVYDKVTIPEGLHARKTCWHIINEYSKPRSQ